MTMVMNDILSIAWMTEYVNVDKKSEMKADWYVWLKNISTISSHYQWFCVFFAVSWPRQFWDYTFPVVVDLIYQA